MSATVAGDFFVRPDGAGGFVYGRLGDRGFLQGAWDSFLATISELYGVTVDAFDRTKGGQVRGALVGQEIDALLSQRPMDSATSPFLVPDLPPIGGTPPPPAGPIPGPTAPTTSTAPTADALTTTAVPGAGDPGTDNQAKSVETPAPSAGLFGGISPLWLLILAAAAWWYFNRRK